MDSNDRIKLARLWAAWVKCRTDAAAQRECLIEKAGERMCAGAPGPTQAEVDALERLEKAHRLAWDAYSSGLLSVYSSAYWASRFNHRSKTLE